MAKWPWDATNVEYTHETVHEIWSHMYNTEWLHGVILAIMTGNLSKRRANSERVKNSDAQRVGRTNIKAKTDLATEGLFLLRGKINNHRDLA